MIDLHGKTALVTGGSRGIGQAVSLLLAQAGADVAVACRKRSQHAETVASGIRSFGRRSLLFAGDLSRYDDVERLFAETLEAWEHLDIVVANAGIWKRCPVDEITESAWRETVDANLSSAVFTCSFAARHMKARREGAIVLISSTAAQRGEPYHSHYAATKGGIVSLTKSLAGELGPWNIRVNCVAPGWVLTDMSRTALEGEKERKAVLQEIPLGRIAEPADIAGAVLFLVSDLARFVQGEILNVNGGSVLCG